MKPDCSTTVEELLAFCKSEVASFKVPRVVRFVDEWPMSSSKIQKFRLRGRPSWLNSVWAEPASHMTPRFGPVVQNAFVVRDLEAAVNYWSSTVGVGPFYLLQHVQLRRCVTFAATRRFPSTCPWRSAKGATYRSN